jgi:tRNA uridine 5-carbamoylmethylation protein Kti12
MRYFLISYYQKPTGQMDEVVSVTRTLKPRDQQTAAVVLDFKTQRVLQCSMNGTTVPKEWDRIVSFYYQHYAATFDRLAKENGIEFKQAESKPEVNPS